MKGARTIDPLVTGMDDGGDGGDQDGEDGNDKYVYTDMKWEDGGDDDIEENELVLTWIGRMIRQVKKALVLEAAHSWTCVEVCSSDFMIAAFFVFCMLWQNGRTLLMKADGAARRVRQILRIEEVDHQEDLLGK